WLPLWLLTSNASEYEDLLMALWSQQWPVLRHSFMFCSGALANRSLDGKLFDFQVVPASRELQLRREVPNARLVAREQFGIPEESFRWATLAAEDLFSQGWSPLRSFMWSYGPDAGDRREWFAQVGEVFLLV